MESAWANRRQAHFPLAQVPRCLLPVSVMSPRWAVPPEECSKGSTPVNPMNVTAVGTRSTQPIRSASIADSTASRAVSTAR